MKQNYFFRRILSAMVLFMSVTLSWGQDSYPPTVSFKAGALYYSINSDGTSVSVTSNDRRDGGYTEDLGDLVIPETVTNEGVEYAVTAIGNSAFYNTGSLTSIVIPKSVTSIGNYAFMDCTFTSIKIPNSVTSIGEHAFHSCKNLTFIVIPSSVTYIGSFSFAEIPKFTDEINEIPKFRYMVFMSKASASWPDVFYMATNNFTMFVPESMYDEIYSNVTGYVKEIIKLDESVKLNIGETGFATYCPLPIAPGGYTLDDLDYYLDFTDVENIAAYRATIEDNTVILKRTYKVGKGEGVLLRSLEGGELNAQSVPIVFEELENPEENAFIGVSETTTIYKTDTENMTNYVLSEVDDIVGFYKAKPQKMDGGTTVPAGKAYIPVPNQSLLTEAKGLTFIFEDGTPTGITETEDITPSHTSARTSTYYTLSGQPVKTPTQKGIYIKDGKKYIIK